MEVDMEERRLFGVPVVLAAGEVSSLLSDLRSLWSATYGEPPGDVTRDLTECRLFFDPLARGHKIRERLSQLKPVSQKIGARLRDYGEPLVTDAGAGVLLVGVEGRLLIELLQNMHADRGHVVISSEESASVQNRALETYREWSLSRLRQVIDLRSGEGKEVMQAVSVGIALALLVNRSDSAGRAVMQWESTTVDGMDVDKAVYIGAEAFASGLTARNKRTAGEKRLKGGYALTEARRRLAHRLVVTRDEDANGARVYIPAEYRDEAIQFLARDLARRSSLDAEKLQLAFDQLVKEFRASARALAYRSMVFESASNTEEIRHQLIEEFLKYREKSSKARAGTLFAAE
jgi:hypothetical protein